MEGGGRGVVLIYLLLWVFSLLPFLPFLPKIREPAPLPKLIKSLPIDLFEAFKIESYCVIDLSTHGCRYLRNANLCDVVEKLLSNHDSGYLNGQLQEATLLTAAIQSILT